MKLAFCGGYRRSGEPRTTGVYIGGEHRKEKNAQGEKGTGEKRRRGIAVIMRLVIWGRKKKITKALANLLQNVKSPGKGKRVWKEDQLKRQSTGRSKLTPKRKKHIEDAEMRQTWTRIRATQIKSNAKT